MAEDVTTPIQKEALSIFEAKKAWHHAQSKLPLKEKVRILLKMQRDDYPILAQRREMKSWEKPWELEP